MECYHARNGRVGNWDNPTELVRSHLSEPGVQPITETTTASIQNSIFISRSPSPCKRRDFVLDNLLRTGVFLGMAGNNRARPSHAFLTASQCGGRRVGKELALVSGVDPNSPDVAVAHEHKVSCGDARWPNPQAELRVPRFQRQRVVWAGKPSQNRRASGRVEVVEIVS